MSAIHQKRNIPRAQHHQRPHTILHDCMTFSTHISTQHTIFGLLFHHITYKALLGEGRIAILKEFPVDTILPPSRYVLATDWRLQRRLHFSARYRA